MWHSWFIFGLLCLDIKNARSEFLVHATWNPSVNLAEYTTSYGQIRLLKFEVPPSSADALWEIQAIHIGNDCPARNIYVYLQQGSFPLVDDRSLFPSDFYLDRPNSRHLVIPSNMTSHSFFVKHPHPGTWVLGMFMKPHDRSIMQKGFQHMCRYYLSSVLMVRTQQNIPTLSVNQPSHVTLSPTTNVLLYKYEVPEGVYRYNIILYTTKPQSPLQLQMDVSGFVLPTNGNQSFNCSTPPCVIAVKSAITVGWNYLQMTLLSNQSLPADKYRYVIKFQLHYCEPYLHKKQSPQPKLENQMPYVLSMEQHHRTSACHVVSMLGRLRTPSRDIWFVFPSYTSQVYNQLTVLPTLPLIIPFVLNSNEDLGKTLHIAVAIIYNRTKDDSVVLLICLSQGYIPELPLSSSCPGFLLTLNSTYISHSIYIPYPSSGTWYLTLQAECSLGGNATDNLSIACTNNVWTELGIVLTNCENGCCGQHGHCKTYVSGSSLLSACDCTTGWHGYLCSQNTDAENPLPSILFLTLSNLAFLPAIILAFYRHLYVEAVVYMYTMFFSTFYHACDGSREPSLCIMKYDVLSFCDFFGSIVSFWVTLLAMSRIHERLRGLLHVLGALCLAVGVEYDRHGLWVFVVPAVTGVVIVSTSWAVQIYRRKRLFPSSRRYLTHLLPGCVLVIVGLVIFARLETESNYNYTHSIWHLVIAFSIVFFLPPANKGTWRMIHFRRLQHATSGHSISELESIDLDHSLLSIDQT